MAALLIMAAGLGSRYGGMKQLDPMGPGGEAIMDYSVYDAVQAGFDKAVFIIRKDFEDEFRERVGCRDSTIIDTEYVFQETCDIPKRYRDKFPSRTKPWGTGHAVLCGRNAMRSPFMVINADDYYGREAFKEGYAYLAGGKGKNGGNICMVSYVLKNTLSDNGAVTRGLCEADGNGLLTKIVETKNIVRTQNGAGIASADGSVRSIDPEMAVSMNMWGLYPDFTDLLAEGFDKFLDGLERDDLSSEYLLPAVIGDLVKDRRICVNVLKSRAKWFGVTYKEDKKPAAAALRDLINAGVYPDNLYK